MPVQLNGKPKRKPGDHTIEQCNHAINNRPIHYKPANVREGREMVRDGERKLIVPDRKPKKCAAIWPESEFSRLENQAHIVTEKEQMAKYDEEQARQYQLFLESEERTQTLKKLQKEHEGKAGAALCKEDVEAAEKTKYVLQRAFELRQEQEDEVKYANSVILAAKCLVVRQAQIVEKELIQKEWLEEERRLDNVMEQQRQKALREEEERKRVRKDRSQKQVQALSQQIRENEVQKLVKLEHMEEESRRINKALIAMQRDDAEKIRLKNEENRKIRETLNKANQDIEQFKIIQREEQRLSDFRTAEFMRKRAEREARRAAELAEIENAKKERRERLLAEQSKALEAAADEAEFLALRVQEEVERQWREKERLAALKKKKDNDDLKASRAQQLEDIRKQQALEIQKEEVEFHKVAKIQQELFEKECEKKNQKREAAVKHRKELLEQINEKELNKINEVKEKFEEGGIIRMEAELRSLNIKNVIRKKTQKMRDNNVPEQFVADVERQLKI